MSTLFKMNSSPASLLLISANKAPWIDIMTHYGWICHQCQDLRLAQDHIDKIGNSIVIIDLTTDDFSLLAVSQLIKNNKHVRWMATIQDVQLSYDTICQFIVSYCFDFVLSPIKPEALNIILEQQLRMQMLERKIWPDNSESQIPPIIGQTLPIKRLREQITRIARTDATVIIVGEQGVGKNLAAQHIHEQSLRKHAPFIIVNCAAMKTKNFEKKVLGQGGESQHGEKSQFELAKGGTLVFKDINMLSLSQQTSLLAFLSEQWIDGAFSVRSLDVRIIVTSCQDLSQGVEEKSFCSQLFYALNHFKLIIPSLKERLTDLNAIAHHYIQVFGREYNSEARSLSIQAIEQLSHYAWPGNIRELVCQIKRAVLMGESTILEMHHFELPTQPHKAKTLKVIKEESEREALVHALTKHAQDVNRAAKDLGISRATIYRLLNKHHLIHLNSKLIS